ncbi:MAG: GAF domain-containing protein [Bryobacteraceae bacterium]|nr:GAF domain-containing protein [Bryobacteraceae bacterium]
MQTENARAAVDLTACDREPIHIPDAIQPHGALLVLDAHTRQLVRASANAEALLGLPPERALRDAAPLLSRVGLPPAHLCVWELPTGRFDVVGHAHAGHIIIEYEPAEPNEDQPAQEFDALVRGFVAHLELGGTIEELAALAAREVRRVIDFDRVLVYRFDKNWNGTVIASDGNGRLPSYLGFRFPASDIPAQARELYRLNRLRMIPDATYKPVPLTPHPAEPLDLTYANLRSVSPIHVEYMRNMGTAASMSFSVIQQGQLWGLISCHHAEPKGAPYRQRAACDLIARVFALQSAALEEAEQARHRLLCASRQTRLLALMAEEENFTDGLRKDPGELLAFADAEGAAIIVSDEVALVGRTPPEPDVRALAQRVMQTRHEVFWTEGLQQLWPEAAAYQEAASGLLAITVSKLHNSVILWFRPEFVTTIEWGGAPEKDGAPDRLHPRRSFEAWRELVRGCSKPWRPAEIQAAAELRNAIVGVVLRRAEETAQLSEQLQRTNQELESFSYSVSHDLRAPFRHIVGYGQLLREDESHQLTDRGRRYLDVIIQSATYAGTLVDNLLNFSRIGRASLHPMDTDMRVLFAEVIEELRYETGSRDVRWQLGELPTAHADRELMRLVVRNLLSNALKYTRSRSIACIDVNGQVEGNETLYSVRDNGVGFDMKYADKLFGVFQRLHRLEDFEGTGIGLANVRRIVSRHGGRTWAEGQVDAGATFYFTLPRPEEV